jgi:methionyl-tRNA formyltransferase
MEVSLSEPIALLGRGRLLLEVLQSLAEAMMPVGEVWYQGTLDELAADEQSRLRHLIAAGSCREHVDNNEALLSCQRTSGLRTVLLCFYTGILSDKVLERVRAVNIHPALLPAYRGRHPLPWMIMNGETTGGVTYHLVTAGVDDGPILAAHPFEILPDDDYGAVLRKVHNAVRQHTGRVMRDWLDGRLIPVPQDESKATYVVKRVPADGLIRWSVPAEAIRRQVLALAAPLPGAFSYLGARRVLVRTAVVAPEFAVFVGRIPGQVACLRGRKAVLTADAGLELLSVVDAESGQELAHEICVNDRFSEGPLTQLTSQRGR